MSLAVSCSPTKNLAPGEVFLRKNKIAIPANVAEESELTPFLRQRENRRVLWTFKLKMWQYLSFNDSVIVAKNEKKKRRIAKKNEKRAKKDPLEFISQGSPAEGTDIFESVIFSKCA